MLKKINISDYDKELYDAILKENQRQEDHIELIASENYVSNAVLQAQGSQLTNKYAEGYPKKRYYGGCEYVDIIEQLAIDRLKKIFKAKYANVQPHSGSQANQAVYASVLKPYDTILGMSLAHGGHLTHGSLVNISGKIYNSISYGLNENEIIDYKQVEDLAIKHKPKMIVAGASSYSLEINWEKFRNIADKIGAYLLVDMAHYAGLIAADEYPNPVPFADFVTSTTHKTLRGPRGGFIISKSLDHEKALNNAIFPTLQGGPLMHVIAAKAIAFKEVLDYSFKSYAKQIKKNANILAQTLINKGFRIVSGKTQSHMFLVDLKDKNITGKKAEEVLGLANITVNKNAVPNDPQSPFITSGIRLGTSAITTRGFKEEETKILGEFIADILNNPDNQNIIQIREKVIQICKKLPVYEK